MRRRLYFLLPDVESAKKVVDELLLARIHDNHIHVLANDKIDLKDLPRATVWQRSDLIHGLELGFIGGAATGVAIGMLLTLLFTTSISTSALFIGATIAGALVGTWASGMIAASMKNSRLKSFERNIEQGELLLMVDVPYARAEEFQSLIEAHHSSAQAEGAEPTIPTFP